MIKNIILLTLCLSSCSQPQSFDLIIHHANILDVKRGLVHENQSIFIKNGRIEAISAEKKHTISTQTIDAKRKLVTPSFIDTHIHPISEFSDGNYALVPDIFPTDSISFYRQKLTNGYLPDGTTTVLMMGHPDSWTDTFLDWTKHSKADQVDVYTCGGALATEDGNPYKGHFRVKNPTGAREKVKEYYDKGIRHLKLYWRLQAPEFKATYAIADSLDMKIFGHVGGFKDPSQLNIFQTLAFGLNNYEHIAILPCSVFNEEDWIIFEEQFEANYGTLEGESPVIIYILETFRYVFEHKKTAFDDLLQQMTQKKGSISTTIGWLYKSYHTTFFSEPEDIGMGKAQKERCHENFKIMMDYLKFIHDSEMDIRIGSDTKDGGKILLLELMLLCEYGLSVEEAVKIASFNGAKAMGIQEEIGTIDVGKKANLIIWEDSPIDDFMNLKGAKIIVKDGVVYNF